MKTKLLGEKGGIGTSIVSALLFMNFKILAYALLVALFCYFVIPSLALYSPTLGDKLFNGYESQNQGVIQAVGIGAYLAASFLFAGFNYRFRAKMRKHFYRETFGMINYRDGVKWYFDNYGVLDIVLTAALSVVAAMIVFARVPQLAAVAFLGIPLDVIGAYVSLRRGLTLWRIHSITCD